MRKVLVIIAVVAAIAAVLFSLELWNRAVEEKECFSYSETTGYWVKYDAMNGCFVLIDNQYLVHKDALVASDRPAFDPEIVGDEAVIKQLLEN